MGGCRCVFRDCKVNTAHHPNMHFFKFPVHARDRFEKWVKFSGADYILNLTLGQQLNRAVCGRHFRDEAFMNYKKDRLCRKEIPTITRISQTLALDYEDLNEDGTPKLIKLEKPTLSHLIAPPDFVCPLDLPLEHELVAASTSSTTPVSPTRKRSIDEESNVPIPNKKSRTIEEPKSPVCNIINKTLLNKSPKASSVDDLQIVFADDAFFEISEIETNKNEESSLPTCGRISVEIETPAIDSKAKKLNDLLETNKTLELNHIKLTKEHKELLAAHDELQMKCDKLEKELKLCESKIATATASPAPATQQQLTKSQLFHGIKRYLCSSMTTLVRMEMFSNNDREWKPDERVVSMDLLGLGDNVYKFFINEWRVRMPSLREVQSWLSKPANSKENYDEEAEDL